MADEPFYKPNAKPLPPREPQPGEPLWVLHKGAERIECELRVHGDFGCEVQLFRNGAFYAGRRFELREGALRHADVLKADLIGLGWQIEP
jgi:hypothetical protein